MTSSFPCYKHSPHWLFFEKQSVWQSLHLFDKLTAMHCFYDQSWFLCTDTEKYNTSPFGFLFKCFFCHDVMKVIHTNIRKKVNVIIDNIDVYMNRKHSRQLQRILQSCFFLLFFFFYHISRWIYRKKRRNFTYCEAWRARLL